MIQERTPVAACFCGSLGDDKAGITGRPARGPAGEPRLTGATLKTASRRPQRAGDASRAAAAPSPLLSPPRRSPSPPAVPASRGAERRGPVAAGARGPGPAVGAGPPLPAAVTSGRAPALVGPPEPLGVAGPAVAAGRCREKRGDGGKRGRRPGSCLPQPRREEEAGGRRCASGAGAAAGGSPAAEAGGAADSWGGGGGSALAPRRLPPLRERRPPAEPPSWGGPVTRGLLRAAAPFRSSSSSLSSAARCGV